MIQTIIFDLGGVFIDDPAADMVIYYAQYLQSGRELLVEALNKHWHMWHRGQISEQDLWTHVTADLNIQCPTCASLWLGGFKQAYKEKLEMFALLKQLKHKGYTTALLSNIETPLVNYLKLSPYEHIDRYFYSCEMGMRKPEKRIYEKVLEELECRPEAAIFIDDRRENVDAAVSLGLPAILFRNCDDLKNQLRHHHISF